MCKLLRPGNTRISRQIAMIFTGYRTYRGKVKQKCSGDKSGDEQLVEVKLCYKTMI